MAVRPLLIFAGLVLVGLAAAAVGVIPPVVIILSLPFLALLAWKPVLRRLAVRNAMRRPRETALVLLGSLLGTAIITGSLIVGDTLHSSIRHGAYTQLGPVDELVSTADARQLPAVQSALARLPSSDVAGTLPITGAVAAVANAPSSRHRLAEPTATVEEVDFPAAATFGGNAAATGISGPTPAPGQAAVGRDLASKLGVRVGDGIVAYAYRQQLQLTVVRILPRLGVAGFNLGDGGRGRSGGTGSSAYTVFVAPGTLAGLASSTPSGITPVAPPVSLLAVSNRGGIIGGAARSATVEQEILQATAAAHLPPPSVTQVKKDLLDAADKQGKSFTQLFSTLGFFGVLAGVLLLVNIFVMLAQERKTELGMIRAVGLRRSGLVGTFSLEGWIYALGSAALGTLAGIGIGRLIVVVAAGIFASGQGGLDLAFSATLKSIQTGFTFGFVISLMTVLTTSVFISRMNVIRAIRDLPEPISDKQRLTSALLGSILFAAGAFISISGIRSNSAGLILLGPAMSGVGLVPLLRRVGLPRRPLISVICIFILIWEVMAFDIIHGAFRRGGISIFLLQGIVLVAAAVTLVSQNQDIIGATLRSLGGGSRNMSLNLGLAYPLAKRFRTGMILAMYSLVVFTLTFLVVFSHLFGNQVGKFTTQISAGFTLVAPSNEANPIPVAAVKSRPDVSAVAALSTTVGRFQTGAAGPGYKDWPVGSFDAAYVNSGTVQLSKRAASYPDDASVYRAVLTDPTALIITPDFLRTGGGPPSAEISVGDTVRLKDPRSGRTAALHVAAITKDLANQNVALVAPTTIQSVFGRNVPDLLFVRTQPGVDPQQVADQINGQFVASGPDAKSFRRIVTDDLSQQQQFFRLMQGYMALGLLVGVAGLGVVMVRAVRERRRQIGILRSLGFSGVAVRRAFMAESTFVALEGVGIGAALALIVSWRLVTSSSFGDTLSYSIPVVGLALLIGGTLVASLIATAAPAIQASRVRPAVALRVAD